MNSVPEVISWLGEAIADARKYTDELAKSLTEGFPGATLHALEWSEGAFSAAARMHYADQMKRNLMGRREHKPDEPEEEALRALLRSYTEELFSRTQSVPGSSGFAHRAIEACRVSELSKLLRDLRFRLAIVDLTVGISA